MKDVLKWAMVPLNTRKRILQSYVWSALLHGAETWTITKVMKTRMKAFELWAYRRMLNISWTEKVTNNEVLSRMKRRQRLFTISKNLKYFGHVNRHSSMHTTLLNGSVNGKRGRGRPGTSLTSNIKEWTGKSYIEVVRLTSNRYGWRIIVLNPLQEEGIWWWWWWWWWCWWWSTLAHNKHSYLEEKASTERWRTFLFHFMAKAAYIRHQQ